MFSSFFSKGPAPITQVSANELDRLPEGTRLIDVREPHEYQEDHLPNAELVPLGTLTEAVRDWDKSVPLLVLCRSGGRSSRAAAELAGLGFQNVMNLEGGMLAVRAGP